MTLSQLQRGHDWPACPSPNQECTCGFSQAFWADVAVQLTPKPLVIELYAGLHGWGEGFAAEGYRSVGFDIVDICALLGHRRPANCQLVLQDVLTLHGSQFKDAAVIVASPPCQAYSYRAMPWSRAKALPPPDNSLFDACFRIQREASEAAGRYIPLIVENMRGAQKWVGKAAWHFGSYYLWGDVPALMPVSMQVKVIGEEHKSLVGSWDPTRKNYQKDHGWKTSDLVNVRDGHSHTRHLTNQAEHVKVPGINFNGAKAVGFNVTAAQRYREGVKQAGISGPRENGKGDKWFQDGAATFGSKSNSRRAASALIAKIPFPLAQHLARCFKPSETELSVAGPSITAVNVSSTRLVTPAPMTAGRTALNPVSQSSVGFCRSCSEPLEDEAILAIHLAAGHQIGQAPLPDSGKKVTGSEAVRGFCEPNAAKALAVKTQAECGM